MATFAAAWSVGIAAQLSIGMMLSIICAEDTPHMSTSAIRQAATDTFLGETLVMNAVRGCERWPRGAVPPDFNDDVRSAAPTLLVSGAVDPVTPPAWAARAAGFLPNSLHVILPNTGHIPGSPGCSAQLIADFIDRGSVEDLDASCVRTLRRPAFALP